MRKILAAIALPAALATVTAVLGSSPAWAQNTFAPAIRVNDQVITGFELEQRARMLTLFNAPGDPRKLARAQLIEDRLKLDAAQTIGVVLEDADVLAGMEEFAGRADMTAEEFTRALEEAGVAEQSFQDFVSAGLAWREVVGARFAPRVSVNETDIERARAALGGGSGGVRVLLSELIMPLQQGQEQTIQDRATRISDLNTVAAFSAQARQYSAAPSAARGGQMDWMPITNLPPQLRPVILGLGPGEVSDPLPIPDAIALFQLRDIEETDAPDPDYSAIEYAAYYIPGGRSDQALARAEQVKNNTDVCDDLYGIAKGQPPEVLERDSLAPDDIPQDIAIELAKLDAGEVSTALTRANGQTLVFLMLCGRTPQIEGEGPSNEQLGVMIRNQRIDSFANGYLEQLRAEARIVDLE